MQPTEGRWAGPLDGRARVTVTAGHCGSLAVVPSGGCQLALLITCCPG